MYNNITQKYSKGTALLIIALIFTITFSLTKLNAQTETTKNELLVKTRMTPESYGLKHILLMNPGDMGNFGLKGGEEVRVCRKDEGGDDSSRDCVIVRVEYGAGVVSGTVMMDIGELNALRLSPGDTFLMELTLP